jgi:hypothetical protein
MSRNDRIRRGSLRGLKRFSPVRLSFFLLVISMYCYCCTSGFPVMRSLAFSRSSLPSNRICSQAWYVFFPRDALGYCLLARWLSLSTFISSLNTHCGIIKKSSPILGFNHQPCIPLSIYPLTSLCDRWPIISHGISFSCTYQADPPPIRIVPIPNHHRRHPHE